MRKSPQPPNSRKKKPFSSPTEYLRYSGIAFQLVGVILMFFFVGYGLDNWLPLGFPVFKLSLSFLGVIVSLYLVIKEISKGK